MVLRNNHLKIGYQHWQQEEGEEDISLLRESKLFQSIPVPSSNSSSGDNAIDPTLQDNVLLPKGFTEYIYHVGNANELNSLIGKGLIPEGTSFKRGRQAVFFTTMGLMEDVHGIGEGSLNSESATSRAKIELAIRKVAAKSVTIPWITAIWEFLPAIEQENTTRENKVKRLIEKFENHKRKDSFIQDLSQTEKINNIEIVRDRLDVQVHCWCYDIAMSQRWVPSLLPFQMFLQ